ncbi:unnamed protein product [Rhizoctonia solani]|uniref:Ricin B lectin domain-containing protein n=1 Tax=Rhizoctonia solani TaxID=456999 RepID=A0A8H3E5K7_9AGAM|nr:unnamed protein product [Rhizoctonia solani]
MGSIYQSPYPSDNNLEPGTYRISNAREKTAIQVSEHDPTQVVAWEQHDGKNQQWFLQRSGHGYQLQNGYYDTYLAVSHTDNHAKVYASRYPTTWIFLKLNGDYIIQLADKNLVIDLHCGTGNNGNVMHIFHQNGSNMPHKIWKLERLSGDTGNKELAQLQVELSVAKKELSECRTLVGQHEGTIHQLQQNLESKEEALRHAHKVNEESVQLRDQCSLLESKHVQQQVEIARLQTRVDRVEYLLSQVGDNPLVLGHY